MNTKTMNFIDEVQAVIERCAAANGTTPEVIISEVLVKLRQEDRHPVHISRSTHSVTVNIRAIRKLMWDDNMPLRVIKELTGVSINTLRRISTYGGKVRAKTAWKLATAFKVPVDSICNIGILKGVVTGWEDTKKTTK